MTEFTVDALRAIMRECAGEDESRNLDGDLLDRPFEELGYDSLALMETTGRIERTLGVVLPEDRLASVATPRELIAFVNARLAAPIRSDRVSRNAN